ncbi:MAG TPA: hypothetical protein ACYCDB_00205 [Candidatus Azoamicus sp.]
MRIFILLIFLITFNLHAKHQNLFDRDNIPKFKPRLEEPFYVKIYIPIAYISFDPYADVIMIRKKNYRNSLIGIIGERVLIATQIKKQTAALNLILKQDKYPKDIFSDLVDIKTQKVAARLHKIRHVKKKEVEPVYNLFFSFTELDDTELIGFLKQIGVKRKEFFLKFLRDTLAVDRLHDRLLVPSLPLTYKQVSKTIYHSNNQGYFTRVMLALIIEIPKYKANVAKMKRLYHFILNENKTPNIHRAVEFKSFLN